MTTNGWDFVSIPGNNEHRMYRMSMFDLDMRSALNKCCGIFGIFGIWFFSVFFFISRCLTHLTESFFSSRISKGTFHWLCQKETAATNSSRIQMNSYICILKTESCKIHSRLNQNGLFRRSYFYDCQFIIYCLPNYYRIVHQKNRNITTSYIAFGSILGMEIFKPQFIAIQ